MTIRTALITGASAGIGMAFAHSLAERGYDLILVARRLDRLETLASELRALYKVTITPKACDLSKPQEVEGLIDTLEKEGLRVDLLVNNAGYSIAHEFDRVDYQAQGDFIQVCVTTPTRLCHAFWPHMKAQGFGRIINIASVAAFSNGAAGHSLYPAAKAYVLKMSRSLNAEGEAHGLYVTAVCPGATESEFHQANGMSEIMKKNPLPSMSAKSVAEAAIIANAQGREVVIPGLFNRLSVWAMLFLPDSLITPLIRRAAKAYALDKG